MRLLKKLLLGSFLKLPIVSKNIFLLEIFAFFTTKEKIEEIIEEEIEEKNECKR